MGELQGTVFSLSRKDVMGGKIYPPSWYRVRFDEVITEPSKNVEVPSTNIVYSCTILFDADSGDKQFADHPLTIRFNSRALGFTKGLLIALGVPEDSITEDTRFDFKNALNKEVDVFVENGLYEGRPTNQVNHKYRAPRAA